MKDLESKKNKHLTLDDRQEIKELLDRGITFKAIAKRLGKDPTTISKEVKKHMLFTTGSVNTKNGTGEVILCPQLNKSPFVCNPCSKRNYCRFSKQLYKPDEAHKAYKTTLTEEREGIPLRKAEFYEIDAIITKGLKSGQHLYQIMQTNNISVSKSTIYRHFDKGYFSVINMDLPRKVKFKPRKSGHRISVPTAAKKGRTYLDFTTYCDENALSSWIEIDTVIGSGSKAIMTFIFTSCNFMFGFLLENKTALEVSEKITALKSHLLTNGFSFGNIFPVILTDNGGEFANIAAFELDSLGAKESLLFFCDPRCAFQKPHVEKNHTLFRDIVPSGSSFDHFTQATVNLIFSHVNSTKRKMMMGKTPFEAFVFFYGFALASVLGIVEIPAIDVVQSPKLLTK